MVIQGKSAKRTNLRSNIDNRSPPASVDKERVAEMEPVAVKWVNRLFTKNTALCQVVKTTYRV